MRNKVTGILATTMVLSLTLMGCSSGGERDVDNGTETSTVAETGEKTKYEEIKGSLIEQQEEENSKKDELAEELAEHPTGEYMEFGLYGVEHHEDYELDPEVEKAEEEYIQATVEKIERESGVTPFPMKAVWVGDGIRAIVSYPTEKDDPQLYLYYEYLQNELERIWVSDNKEEELEVLEDDHTFKNNKNMYEDGFKRASLRFKEEDELVPEILKGHARGIADQVTGRILFVAYDGEIIIDDFIPSEFYE